MYDNIVEAEREIFIIIAENVDDSKELLDCYDSLRNELAKLTNDKLLVEHLLDVVQQAVMQGQIPAVQQGFSFALRMATKQ